MCFAHLFWDPDSVAFYVPFLGHPVTWYGLLFATGFWIGFHIFVFLFKKFLRENSSFNEKEIKKLSRDYAERLIIYIVGGTIIGARLGHILFYENPMEYIANPLAILKTWEGGLASHGGALGVVVSLWLFHRKYGKDFPHFSFWHLLDFIAIPTMLVSALIRVGNFFNQEILGVATNKPWGVIFGHPADGGGVVARHPAQLYESIWYLSLFGFLFYLWYRVRPQAGRIGALALAGPFAFRFFIEYLKTGQSIWYDTGEGYLFMGQLLSLPLVALGASLFFMRRSRKN